MKTTIIKQPFPLWALISLSTAYFIVGTSSLSVIALTWQISGGLDVPPTDIAYLMTVFALTFAFSAPLMQVFFSRFSRFTILSGGLVILAGGLVLSALSPNFWTLFAARALMGFGAAAISPMCSAIGAGLSAPEQQGRAIGIVFAGLTFATVLGTPMSAWLGTVMEWRQVMALLAGLTLACLVGVRLLVKDRQKGAPLRLYSILEALLRFRSGSAVLVTFLQMTASFCIYALIAPLMSEKFGMAEAMIGVVLLFYGVHGVLGNVIAGWLSDRMGTTKIITISLIGVGVGYLIIWVIGPVIWLAFLGIAIWAACGMMFHSPQQQRIANIDPEKRSLLLALHASALYLGISSGSSVSRFVAVTFGIDWTPFASFAFLALCLVLFLATLLHERKEPS